MGRRYAQTGQLTSAASTTRASFIGASTCRPKTNFIMLSAINATPNDYVVEYNVKRISAIGSLAVTSRTPTPLDSADPNPGLIAGGVALTGINATGEPTYTSASELLMFSHNMHAVFQFYAPDGGEIVQAASATTGLGLFTVGGTTIFSDAMTWHFSE
jgi:hypothetical protein